MREIIIAADISKTDMKKISAALRKQDYNPGFCRTINEVIEKLEFPPVRHKQTPLVIIEKEMLVNINQKIITKLVDYAPNVPFTIIEKADISLSSGKNVSELLRHSATLTGAELYRYVSEKQCLKILILAGAELSAIDTSAADAGNILKSIVVMLSSAMMKIMDITPQVIGQEAKILAETTKNLVDLLENSRLSERLNLEVNNCN